MRLFFLPALVHTDFAVYLRLGFEHITDLGGYDHMLFIAALCAAYHPAEWRKVLVLVTAFTVGHSITLALAVLNLVPVHEAFVEVLIPLTIVLTCLANVVRGHAAAPAEPIVQKWGVLWSYVPALGFGLVHGMGFSSFLRAVLGHEDSIAVPLFAFNIGLELGQGLVVLIVLALSASAHLLARMSPRAWNLFVSGTTGVVAAVMLTQRIINQ